jgi:hypothetical protein
VALATLVRQTASWDARHGPLIRAYELVFLCGFWAVGLYLAVVNGFLSLGAVVVLLCATGATLVYPVTLGSRPRSVVLTEEGVLLIRYYRLSRRIQRKEVVSVESRQVVNRRHSVVLRLVSGEYIVLQEIWLRCAPGELKLAIERWVESGATRSEDSLA